MTPEKVTFFGVALGQPKSDCIYYLPIGLEQQTGYRLLLQITIGKGSIQSDLDSFDYKQKVDFFV